MDFLNKRLNMLWSIVDFGKGSKLLNWAKEVWGLGGVLFLGKGTVKSETLNLLGILETRKEIFLTVIDEEREDAFYDEMVKKFYFDKPCHGIAFSMPIKYCLRVDGSKKAFHSEKKGLSHLSYEAIFVIVDKHSVDDVLEAAKSAGSTGGTIIHGRGAGSQKKETLFNIQIEPEKEIVLILSKAEKTEAIVNAIKDKLNIHEENAGIIFVMDVSRTVGLYQE